jgi:hypothetical protein
MGIVKASVGRAPCRPAANDSWVGYGVGHDPFSVTIPQFFDRSRAWRGRCGGESAQVRVCVCGGVNWGRSPTKGRQFQETFCEIGQNGLCVRFDRETASVGVGGSRVEGCPESGVCGVVPKRC